MRSLPIFGIGLGLALLGLALFALTLRKDKTPPAIAKKSEVRDQQAREKDTGRLRMTAAAVTVGGVVLMLIS